MSAYVANEGWHPDPENPSTSQRWWDGAQWTSSTRPALFGSVSGLPAPPPVPSNGWAPSGSPIHVPAPLGGSSFIKRNSLSLTTLAVVAVYVVIALNTRIVLFGIFPVLLAVRAVRSKESLAPLAVVAAIVAVLVAVTAFSHL